MNKHDVYLITGRGDGKNWLAKKLFGYESHINPTSSVSDDGLPIIITADKLISVITKLPTGITAGKVMHLIAH